MLNTKPSLTSRAIRSLAYVASGHTFGQIIRLGGNLITTRLLAPELFGIMVISTTIMIGLEMMSDLSVRSSIIQSTNTAKLVFRRTAWVFQIARGSVLSLLNLLIALLIWASQVYSLSPAESVYSDPKLPVTVGLLSLVIFIRSFSSIDIFLAERSLQFGKVTLHQILSQSASVGAIIVWAMIDPTIWALVGGLFVGVFFSVSLSHVLFPSPANRFGWDLTFAKELFHFGKWLMLSSGLSFISNNGDRLIFGYFLTTADLGRYAIAVMLIEALKGAFQKLQQVWYPALCETARKSPENLSYYYYRIRQYQDPIIFLLSGFLMIAGDNIVIILYDARYADAGWMFQILTISLALSAYTMKGSVILATGRSKIIWYATLTTAVALIIGLPLSFWMFGIKGAVIWMASLILFRLPVTFSFFQARGYLRIINELRFLPFIIVGWYLGYVFQNLKLSYL